MENCSHVDTVKKGKDWLVIDWKKNNYKANTRFTLKYTKYS